MDADLVPAIDVSRLDGSPAERAACAADIGRACRSVGFFHIINHGVGEDLRQEVFGLADRFFAASLAEKMQVALSAETAFLGYFPLKGEVTDPAAGGDLKEGFDISFGAADGLAGGVSANRWPERPQSFQRVLTRYYETMAHLGRTLSRGFALALNLPEDFFAAKLDQPTAILRLLHYPPSAYLRDANSLPPTGCGAHSDYGYLTILAQDDQGGLQVQTRAGRWINVPPLAGAFVCNIGEMMAMWTNNHFRATPHRVVRIATGARYSVPFFFHPNPDVVIEPLATCREEGKPLLHPAVTSGAYLHGRQTGAYLP